MGQRHHFATGADGAPETPPQIGESAATHWPQAAALLRRPARRKPREQSLHVGEIAGRALLERLPPKDDVARVAGGAAIGARLPRAVLFLRMAQFSACRTAGQRGARGQTA